MIKGKCSIEFRWHSFYGVLSYHILKLAYYTVYIVHCTQGIKCCTQQLIQMSQHSRFKPCWRKSLFQHWSLPVLAYEKAYGWSHVLSVCSKTVSSYCFSPTWAYIATIALTLWGTRFECLRSIPDSGASLSFSATEWTKTHTRQMSESRSLWVCSMAMHIGLW